MFFRVGSNAVSTAILTFVKLDFVFIVINHLIELFKCVGYKSGLVTGFSVCDRKLFQIFFR